MPERTTNHEGRTLLSREGASISAAGNQGKGEVVFETFSSSPCLPEKECKPARKPVSIRGKKDT